MTRLSIAASSIQSTAKLCYAAPMSTFAPKRKSLLVSFAMILSLCVIGPQRNLKMFDLSLLYRKVNGIPKIYSTSSPAISEACTVTVQRRSVRNQILAAYRTLSILRHHARARARPLHRRRQIAGPAIAAKSQQQRKISLHLHRSSDMNPRLPTSPPLLQ